MGIEERANDSPSLIRDKLWVVVILANLSLGIGTFGYYLLSGGEYDLLTCAYMTVITLTTVGFGEVIPVTGDPALEFFTSILIVTGMGLVVYFTSVLTAEIVGRDFFGAIRERRMTKRIAGFEHHFIVAGIGDMGIYAAQEIILSGRQLVAIDDEHARFERLLALLETKDHPSLAFIVGDATDDDVLHEAGIERATTVLFALGDDRENLFATITARTLNPRIRIISRGKGPKSQIKFRRAGADSVIFTDLISGLRMASEGLRPSAVSFLDVMLKDHETPRRVEEIELPAGSPLVGRTLKEVALRDQADVLVVAVYRRELGSFDFNPGPEYVLHADATLIVIVRIEDRASLERYLREG